MCVGYTTGLRLSISPCRTAAGTKNTEACSKLLNRAARDAIYLDLIDGRMIVDNKNPAAAEFLFEAQPAEINAHGGEHCPD